MKELINGLEVEVSASREAEILAQRAKDAANAAAQSVPPQVTMRQARLALRATGKLGAVAPAIAALPSPQREDAEIEWEFSSVVERHRPFVVSLGGALGLSSAALDALFIEAAKL